MNPFPITENIESAIHQAQRCRRDALGYAFHTFRVRLTDEDRTGHVVLSGLVDRGWQLQGGPVIIEAKGDLPRHVIVTMFQADPRPLRLNGRMDFRGEGDFRGELQGD
jgi:hypothetical protein